MSGAFLTLEGGEGTGKTTQSVLLVRRLREEGIEPVALREPGGTPLGDAARILLLDPDQPEMDAWAEVMLYEASRAQLVSAVISPALDSGSLVVCDRFTDSTLAYQGYGRGLPLDTVRRLNETASEGVYPDLTILFDVEVEEGLVRATRDGSDRLERQEREFHERVRAGFLEIAAAEPDRVKVVDASAGPAEVFESVWDIVAASGLIDRGRKL